MTRTLRLDGLIPAPAQVWGRVRLVPLIREQPVDDVRLALRDYSAEQLLAITRVDPQTSYLSYVPHGLVMSWSPNGSPVAAVDTRLGAKEVRTPGVIVELDKMARGLGPNALRLLPLHLAMEGFLAQHFGGPDVAYAFWSRQALRDGLSPRVEFSVRGDGVPGLAEALTVFERHRGQCGVLVFIGDQLASACAVGHPEDYVAIHDALLTDFYGTLFAQWGWAFREVQELPVTLTGRTIPEIRASLQQARSDWAAFAQAMASGLFPREVLSERVRTAGRFELIRFATDFDVKQATRDGEHIGEALVDGDGRIVYLKTYRLDRGQIRRGYLLSELARVEWDAQRLADEQGHGDLQRIVRDLEAAELGWMVHVAFRARR